MAVVAPLTCSAGVEGVLVDTLDVCVNESSLVATAAIEGLVDDFETSSDSDVRSSWLPLGGVTVCGKYFCASCEAAVGQLLALIELEPPVGTVSDAERETAPALTPVAVEDAATELSVPDWPVSDQTARAPENGVAREPGGASTWPAATCCCVPSPPRGPSA